MSVPHFRPSVTPLRPLSPSEQRVARCLAHPDQLTYRQIGEKLGLSTSSVRNCVNKIAWKLPGRLPAKIRVQLWSRGAPAGILTGEPPSTL